MRPFDFIVSDLHIMHENIRLYCPQFREHYSSREEMSEGIKRILLKQIPAGAHLMFVGDLSLNFDEGLKFIKDTPWTWTWIAGNHDKVSRINTKGYVQTRIKALKACPNLKLIADEQRIQVGDKWVLVNHFPWADAEDERHGAKYMEYRPRRQDYPGISFLLFGHRHSTPDKRLGDRCFDVGFDGIGRAYSYEEIEEIINGSGALPT